MKIKKTPPKRLPSPVPVLKALIRKLTQALNGSEEDVLTVLEPLCHEWIFPKADLFHFVNVLNRLDQLLEGIIKRFGIGAPLSPKETAPSSAKEETLSTSVSIQKIAFQPATKRLLLSILRFTLLLQENATNRSVYNSYEHLNNLLLTSDLDVLEATLKLILRPAQRINSQRSLKNAFTVQQDRILALVKSWGSKEQGYRYADYLSGPNTPMSTLTLRFYRTPQKVKETSSEEDVTDVKNSLSRPSSREGLVSIPFPMDPSAEDGLYGKFEKLVEQYGVPDESRSSVLHFLRISTASPSFETRSQLVVIRNIALAISFYILNEGSAQTQIFQQEQYLIADLSSLLHVDKSYPLNVQSSVMHVFEALTLYRGKLPEVLTALNVSANHGMLMFILRKVVADLEKDGGHFPDSFLDALLSLFTSILVTQTGGNMLISAGIIPILVGMIKIESARQLKVVTRCLGVLDNILYGFGTSFNSFVECEGLKVVTNRVQSELEICMNYHSTMAHGHTSDSLNYSEVPTSPLSASDAIPFERIVLMKGLLKFLWHLMQTSGTTDRVRNLIESSLPSNILTIVKNSATFGPTIFALAINLLATFIHNEPQTFNVLNENSIPATFLDTIQNDIPPATEILSAIPYALGALCLNANGLELVKSKNPFPRFFSILSSQEHFRVLLDEDVASLLGHGLDELVRHHPPLKDLVMGGLVDALKRIVETNSAVPSDDFSRYSFYLQSCQTENVEVKMVDNETKAEEPKQSTTVLCIEVVARLLECFFETAQHCKDFMSLGGRDLLLRLYSTETLPYDFASSSTSYSLSHVFRIMAECEPSEVLVVILKELDRVYQDASDFLNYDGNDSMLAKYVSLAGKEDDIKLANKNFRSVINLHSIVGLLSDVYSTPVQNNVRSAASIVQTFSEESGKRSISQLWHFYRCCAVESLFFKTAIPKQWLHTKKKASSNDPSQLVTAANSRNRSSSSELVSASEQKDVSGTNSLTGEIADPNDPRIKNTRYFKYLLSQSTAFIVPIFKGLSRLLMGRRTDVERCVIVASSIMTGLHDHFTWNRGICSPLIVRYQFIQIGAALEQALIVDERSNNSLSTILAFEFEQSNGLEVMYERAKEIMTDSSGLTPQNDNEVQKETFMRVKEVLRSILKVFLIYVSSKSLHSSPHTHYLIGKDRISSALGVSSKRLFDPHAYLVKVRSKIAAFITYIWENPLIFNLELTEIKLILQIISAILNGEGEKDPEKVPPVAAALPNRTVDENKINQLTDMGFSREAAERALNTCGQNVMRAAEYLLLNPASLGETQAEPEEAISDDGDDDYVDIDDDDKMETDHVDRDEGDSESAVKADDFEVYMSLLRSERKSLQDTILKRCVELLDNKPEAVFEIKELLSQVSRSIGEDLFVTEIIRQLSLDEYILNSKIGLSKPASRFHLLALLLSDNSLKKHFVKGCSTIVAGLLKLLALDPWSSDDAEEQQQRIDWLAPVMLIIEAYISFTESSKCDFERKEVFILTEDDKMSLISPLLKIVKDPKCSDATTQSAYRLLVRLTRNNAIAKKIVDNYGINVLFTNVSKSLQSFGSLFILILRHIAEDVRCLEASVEREIVSWFGFPRSRTVELSSVIKNFASIAAICPEIFVKAITNVCRLKKAETFGRQYHISLLKDEVEPDENIQPPAQLLCHKVLMEEAILGSPVTRILISSLLEEFNSLNFADINSEASDHSKKCLLIQTLAELFDSYPPSKLMLLDLNVVDSFMKRLFENILPYPSIQTSKNSSNENFQLRVNESNWASHLLSVLCTSDLDKSNLLPSGDYSPIQVLVIKHLESCLQESSNVTVLEVKYGRIHAYADLISKLLTAKSSMGFGMLSSNIDSTTSVVKLLVERHFVDLLTGILNVLDVNYPEIRTLANSLLRPLENLSRLANKLSKANGSPASPVVAKKRSLLEFVSNQGSMANLPTAVSDNFIQDSALGGYVDNDMEMDSGSDNDEEDQSDEEFDEMDEMDDEHGDFTDMSEESVSSDHDGQSEEMEMEVVVRPGDAYNEIDQLENENDESDESDIGEGEVMVESHVGEWESESNPHDDLASDEDEDSNSQSDPEDNPDLNQGSENDVDGENMLIDETDPDDGEDDEDDENSDDQEMYGDVFEEFDTDIEGPFSMHGNVSGQFRQNARFGGARRREVRRARPHDFGVYPDMQIHVSDGINPPVVLNDIGAFNFSRITGEQNMRGDGVSVHPLLDPSFADSQTTERPIVMAEDNSSATQSSARMDNFMDLAMRDFTPGHALQLLEQVLANATVPGTFRIQMPGGSGEPVRVTAMQSSSDALGGAAADQTELHPVRTKERWLQEAKLMFPGTPVNDLVPSSVQDKVLQVLLPIAQEEDRLKKEAEDKKRQEAEEERRRKEAKEAEERAAAERVQATSAATANSETAAAMEAVQPTTTGANSITIHGTTIDLTNSGIDPTFLEALPEELRAEVLAQHFRDQMRSGVSLPAEISPEFLEALPEDIREELVQQEQVEQQLRQRTTGGGPMSMALSAAAQMLSLEGLESQSWAEDGNPIAQLLSRVGLEGGATSLSGGVSRSIQEQQKKKEEKKQNQREPDVLADKNAIMGIVRYIYVANAPSRNHLNLLLVNLCENSRSRTDLLSLLLTVIHEYSLGAEVKTPKGKEGKSRSTPRKSSFVQSLSLASGNVQLDNHAAIFIQRSLDVLLDLVSKNEAVALFFLSEMELGLWRSKTKTKQFRCPLTDLMSFMQRSIFRRNTNLMDALTQLIAEVTQLIAKAGQKSTGSQGSSSPPAEPLDEGSSTDLRATWPLT